MPSSTSPSAINANPVIPACGDQLSGAASLSHHAVPDATQSGCPARLILWLATARLHPATKTNGTLLELPAFELEDPLLRALVEPEQASYRTIAEGQLFQNHLANRFGKALLHLELGLHRLIVRDASGNPKPGANLADSHIETVLFESLADGLDYLSSSPNRDADFLLARSSSMTSP